MSNDLNTPQPPPQPSERRATWELVIQDMQGSTVFWAELIDDGEVIECWVHPEESAPEVPLEPEQSAPDEVTLEWVEQDIFDGGEVRRATFATVDKARAWLLCRAAEGAAPWNPRPFVIQRASVHGRDNAVLAVLVQP